MYTCPVVSDSDPGLRGEAKYVIHRLGLNPSLTHIPFVDANSVYPKSLGFTCKSEILQPLACVSGNGAFMPVQIYQYSIDGIAPCEPEFLVAKAETRGA
jgi:hypothetical protein